MKKTTIIFVALLVITTVVLVILKTVALVESFNALHKSDECERLGGTGVVDMEYRVICLKDSALLQEGDKNGRF